MNLVKFQEFSKSCVFHSLPEVRGMYQHDPNISTQTPRPLIQTPQNVLEQ